MKKMSIEPTSKKQKKALLCETDISKYYMHDKNEKLGLCFEKLSIGSEKDAWFYCPDCNHEYKQMIYRFFKNKSRCPYCATINHRLCGDKDCNFCNQRSVYSTKNGSFWNFEKNDTEPWKVSRFSAKSYFFNCPTCKHTIKLIPLSLTDKYTCGQCSEKWRFCDDDTCDFCFNRSFATVEKSRILHPTKNTEDVLKWSKCSNKKAWFICDTCSHELYMSLSNVYQGQWCKFCNGVELCKNDTCDICFKLSFASNPLSKYWSSKNKKTPREVRSGSHLNIIFDCPFCNCEYVMILKAVTRGNWCGCKKHKTEELIFYYLKTEYQNVFRDVSFNWCLLKSGWKGRFDILIENTFLEVDGGHHFKKIDYWKTNNVEENQKRDIKKMRDALSNGYSFIRIFQEDVWKNQTGPWKTQLVDAINKLQKEPGVIFIESNDKLVTETYSRYYEACKDLIFEKFGNDPYNTRFQTPVDVNQEVEK